MDNTFIESVWWALKEADKKGLLYEGKKVLLYCPHCETPIAKAEIAMDNSYKDVAEESVTVEFRVKGEKNRSLLAWTTTPWTLPGNVALAINPKVGYVMLEIRGEQLVLAESGVGALGKDYKILKKIKGSELVGREYEPLYPNKAPYKIVAGDFVSTEEGTGIVHIAPAFGDDDFSLSKKYDLPVLITTSADGIMQPPGEPWDGEWFSAKGGSASGGKKADKMIIDDLKSRGLLFKTRPYGHDYPFCWGVKIR